MGPVSLAMPAREEIKKEKEGSMCRKGFRIRRDMGQNM